MFLEVCNGSYRYPGASAPVLSDISMSVRPNTVMTILGRNGIGKTTLIKCMAGILPWTKGRSLIKGKEIQSVKDTATIAFVPQAYKLSYPYTVKDLVVMGRVRHMGMLSIPSKKDREVAEQVLHELGIADLADRDATKLSGGQRQLAFIARALASEPEMLVMDEPESHLDFKNQHFILRLISQLVRQKGLACIINTHYPEHALRISDATLMLGEGKYCVGPTEEIITEANIRDYFDVRARISEIEDEGRTYKTFFVLG
ncbi:MAG: ABC transporter ATP-binding protein [Brachymonas sp.]|nr:ABC transporter ATP-binding protein [Brachymonas sp.]